MRQARILIVEDEAGVRFGLRDYLESHGYEVEEAASCGEVLDRFPVSSIDAVVLDYKLPDGTALDLLPRMKEWAPAVPVVVLTAHGSIDLAVRAVKEGAEQFLTKPIELDTLRVVVERALENRRNRQQQLARRSRAARHVVDPFLGGSRAIRALAAEARRVLASDGPVLICGETGTGKGVLAAWLHEQGSRSEEAFVDLNCAGLSRELLENELFGHEKGAFTGANTDKLGLVEIADRGTLLLDEIGDMDPTVQPKLLKVLEEKRFRRLGSVRDRRVDVRLISATHRDLERLVRENRFRADLYFRINTLPLRIPALRERGEDVLSLAQMLLARIASDLGRELRLAPDASGKLLDYSWPGNIRELRNVLERAALLSEGDAVGREDLRFQGPSPGDPSNDGARLTLAEMERRHIERALREENGHVEQAARRLDIPRSTLYEKLKKLRIADPDA